MSRCFECKKKISLALAVSTSKCICDKLFCNVHKINHTSTCESFQTDSLKKKTQKNENFLNGKSIENGKLIDRI